jgi:medium-chain acyl-[acyl-carrier-protein] hydrolase
MSGWIQCGGTAGARARVICVPRAGGTARDFDQWRGPMGAEVEVCAVQLPGRLDRFREPALDDLGQIATEVAAVAQELAPKPTVLVGDCMGALIAYEAARALRRSAAAAPLALVVSSYPAPDRARTEQPYHDAPVAEFRERLRDVGGAHPDVLEDDELFELMLPTLRADFAAFERYRYVPEAPLEIGVYALLGRDDPYVSTADLQGWQAHTSHGFIVRDFAGGHFFLPESQEAVQFVRDLALGAAQRSGQSARA